jgi:hypothetical protein
VAARAIAGSEEEMLARCRISFRGMIDRGGTQRFDKSHQRIKIRLREIERRHSRIRNAVLDGVSQVRVRPSATSTPIIVYDTGRVLTARSIQSVTSSATRRKLLPAALNILRMEYRGVDRRQGKNSE